MGLRLQALDDRCHLFIKFRGSSDGRIHTDTEPCRLQNSGDVSYVASTALSNELRSDPLQAGCGLFYFEGTSTTARCVFFPDGAALLNRLYERDPSVRLAAYDLPPTSSTLIDSTNLVRQLLGLCSEADPELFAPQAAHFLNGPHIVDQLLMHLMELKVDEAPNFLTVSKGIADQLRGLLAESNSEVKILRVERSHRDAWAEVYGSMISFVDGGAARLIALPGVEPAAMRVGTYSVVPGDTSHTRESFNMETRLIADMTDGVHPQGREPDRKRLQEASRYVLELLVCLQQAKKLPPPEVVYLHGPLVNQFVTYDDAEPHNLPGLDSEFLARYGIDQEAVTSHVAVLPRPDKWNQFTAVYGYLLRRLEELSMPVVGVVERPTGTPVSNSVLQSLKDSHVVTEPYVNRIKDLLARYRITDTFLFGCLLAEGEYITPIPISKNPVRRAHPDWQPVVRQFFRPFAMVLKPVEAMPPFRMELNAEGRKRSDSIARLTYHTSRLLPQYAFPVGLDIVDKYAKVPDWISKGVSVTMAASVLRRAMREGDARVFAQARHFLAGEPRDFFYRPGTRA